MENQRMVAYAWHSDDGYYATVVNRYYRQVSLPLRLGVQAASVRIITSAVAIFSDIDLVTRCVWLAVSAAFSLAFPYLVKRGILLKYRLRTTFGAETTFKMNATGALIGGPGAGRFPWNVCDRAVSFSDGLLLVRKGGIRWLPHEAIKEGQYAFLLNGATAFSPSSPHQCTCSSQAVRPAGSPPTGAISGWSLP